MRVFTPEILEVLSKRRYARSNFLAAYLGGSFQNRTRDIRYLRDQKLISVLPFHGNGRHEHSYPNHFFRIIQKADAPPPANHLWHQVLLDDFMISVEMACKKAGLRFRDKQDIIGDAPLNLPCSVDHVFEKERLTFQGSIEPDWLFAIEDTYFALEVDRGTEPQTRSALIKSSYLRKLLQYRDVLKKQTYKEVWDIPGLTVLNITSMDTQRVTEQLKLMQRLGFTSKSICFASYPTLSGKPTINKQTGEYDLYSKAPQPLLSILTDPMQRAGYDPYYIGREVTYGRHYTHPHQGADRDQAEDRRRA